MICFFMFPLGAAVLGSRLVSWMDAGPDFAI
jgi:hypothetical protein